jgi:hypothetical protein
VAVIEVLFVGLILGNPPANVLIDDGGRNAHHLSDFRIKAMHPRVPFLWQDNDRKPQT